MMRWANIRCLFQLTEQTRCSDGFDIGSKDVHLEMTMRPLLDLSTMASVLEAGELRPYGAALRTSFGRQKRLPIVRPR